MVSYLVLACAAAAAFGLIRWGRKSFYKLATYSTGVLNVMLGDQDDEEKLEELQDKTLKLILALFTFLGLVLAACLVFIGLCAAYSHFLKESEPKAFEALESWQGMLAFSIGATLPFLIPFKKSPSGYSELAILLHRMVLNNYQLGLKLYWRERKKTGLPTRSDFLIVSGLARAGTTSLMNQLAELKEFRSLNYSNMPFLLSPNTWAKFYKPKNGETKERSHKDGIQIGLQSNEALEEYFWKAQAQDSFIGEHFLEEYGLSADAAQEYLHYQSLVRKSPSEVYLAKNNNFLLRYQSLRSYNADFLMVILFRSPMLHAASLLEKHLQYQKLQSQDPFVKEYMDWLGHHEFGLGQKPFVFEGQDPPQGDKNHIDYWLQIWIQYYEKVLSLETKNLLLVDYESFCAEPGALAQQIGQQFGASAESLNLKPYLNKRKPDAYHDSPFREKAEAIYNELLVKRDK